MSGVRVGVATSVFCMWRRGPHVWIDPTKLLFISRAKPPAVGFYSLPGGGLELGETIATCAVRECKEETGLSVTITSPVTPVYTATDAIFRESADAVPDFHFAVLHALAYHTIDLDNDNEGFYLPDVAPQDDVDEAIWVELPPYRDLPLPNNVRIANSVLRSGQPLPKFSDLHERNVLVENSAAIIDKAQDSWLRWVYLNLK